MDILNNMNGLDQMEEIINYNIENIHNCLPCNNQQNKLLQKRKKIILKKVKQKHCIVLPINWMEW